MLRPEMPAVAPFLPLLLALCAGTPPTLTGPRIELVTIAPGDALYTLWGHAALRVIEDAPRRDLAYNFGSIDFSGAFFARLLAGEVEASVGVSPFHRTAALYRQEGRSIVRRPLNLSPEEARRLAADLRERTKGGGSRYTYDHFADNCSTQVADAIDRAMQGVLSAQNKDPSTATLRKMALGPVREHGFLYVLLDSLLTAPVDRPIQRWQARFLPSEFATLIDTSQRAQGGPVAGPPIVDFRGRDADTDTQWTWPWVKVYLLIVVPLLFFAFRFPRSSALIWTALCGLYGLALALVAVATGYDFLRNNWNLLVVPPTHLIAFFVLAKSSWLGRPAVRNGLRVYACLHMVVLAGLLGASVQGLMPQAIDPVLGLALGPAFALLIRPYRARTS